MNALHDLVFHVTNADKVKFLNRILVNYNYVPEVMKEYITLQDIV